MSLKLGVKEEMPLLELIAHQMSLVEQTLACNRAIAERLAGAPSVRAGPTKALRPIQTVTTPKGRSGNKAIAAQGSLKNDLKKPLLDPEVADEKVKEPFPEVDDRVTEPSPKGDEKVKEPFPVPKEVDPPAVLQDMSKAPTMHLQDEGNKTEHDEGRKASKEGHSLLSLPNDAEMKERIRKVVKGQTTYEGPYKDSGFWQALAKNSNFQKLTTLVIVVNVLWLAYDVDNNPSDILFKAPLCFQVAENVFCTYFLLEIVVRFLAMKSTCLAFSDGWFLFDSSLVLLMVWTTWCQGMVYESMDSYDRKHSILTNASAMRVFRILRLVRVFRAADVTSALPELVVIFRGMVEAMRSGLCILVALFGIIYIFAIFFTTSLRDNPVAANAFENVPQAMNFLLMRILCGHDPVFIGQLLDTNIFYYVSYLMFLFMCTLIMMNMLVGVLCGVVSSTAEAEAESKYISDTFQKVGAMLHRVDADGSNLISHSEFMSLLTEDSMILALEEQSVDAVSLIELSRFLYRDRSEVTIPDILELITQNRTSKGATVRDITELRKFMASEVRSVVRH